MRHPTVDKLIRLIQKFSSADLESNMCWRLSRKDASGLLQYVSTTDACRGVWGEVRSVEGLNYLFGIPIVSVSGAQTTLRKGVLTNKERIALMKKERNETTST